jgi:hypothetical protein
MTEKQYENALYALGCKNVTSNVQKKNGTTAFRMPDGKNMITEHETGYIRRTVLSGTGRVATCYQLNPTYPSDYQVIAQDGKLYTYKGKKRMFIMSRKTRLKKLFLYTIKKLNNEK